MSSLTPLTHGCSVVAEDGAADLDTCRLTNSIDAILPYLAPQSTSRLRLASQMTTAPRQFAGQRVP